MVENVVPGFQTQCNGVKSYAPLYGLKYTYSIRHAQIYTHTHTNETNQEKENSKKEAER